MILIKLDMDRPSWRIEHQASGYRAFLGEECITAETLADLMRLVFERLEPLEPREGDDQ